MDWYFVGIAAALVCAVCSLIVASVSIMTWRRTAADVASVRQCIIKLEANQPQYLTGRNLGPIHEKINGVANDVAAIHAQMNAQSEQLRAISKYLMKP